MRKARQRHDLNPTANSGSSESQDHRSVSVKRKRKLELEKWIELPDRVVKGQVLTIFKPEIRKNFVVEELIRTERGTWVIKLSRLPHPIDKEKEE